MTARIAGFLLAVLPLVAVPGASLTLLVSQVAAGGRRRAVPVVAGTVCGLAVHACLALAGLSAAVMHSAEAFTAVRLAGAAYLLGLGLWTLRPPRTARPRRARGSAFTQALLGNVLNPKAASIFLTVLPQFLDPARPVAPQVAALAAAQALLVAGWLLGWTALLATAERALRDPVVRRRTGQLGGAVLIALGLRAALA
ncbi:LysE family translocator [Kitasatospora terrestris]|uniref:LysE family translocator n=1 Tax=Kitasatospora terrestris TaxID=258051 RepID=A0ABP9ECL7_9ACTN